MIAAAKAALLLLVLSLAFPKLGLPIAGLQATATDVLFLVVLALVAVALWRRQAKFRWDSMFLGIAAYFATMLVALLASPDPLAGLPKLAAQAYLVTLPVLVHALVDDAEDLRRLFLAWLAGTAVTAAIGSATLLLFAAGVERSLIDYGLHYFGSLPPGDYPRLESTFAYPAMLCNYLTVSLAILILCHHRDWISPRVAAALLALILPTAAFTLTPGLGGIALLLGAWLLVILRPRAPGAAKAVMAAAVFVALSFVAAATVTPIVHPTAPFLLHLPGIDAAALAPSVRMMTWIEAVRAFLAHPIVGTGPGADPISVLFVSPSGETHVLTDAHNVFLNVATQAGLFGLAAVVMLIVLVARRMSPWRVSRAHLLPLGLGFAWLDAFAFQGLTGSYEDARHLWVLLGLFLAADRLQPRPDGASTA